MNRGHHTEPAPEARHWSHDDRWVERLLQIRTGTMPNAPQRLDLGNMIDRFGWQVVARAIRQAQPEGVGQIDDVLRRTFSLAMRRQFLPVDRPETPDPAAIQAIGLCVTWRHRVTGPMPETNVLHGNECSWCGYPTEALIGRLREYNEWRDTTPEGRNTDAEWWRRGSGDRLAALRRVLVRP